jgi:large subunit ribosomal protein L23
MIKASARVTEKGYSGLGRGEYTFKTTKDITKTEFITYIKNVYSVDVVKIKSLNVKGKAVSRGRISGKRPDYKKMIITLKKGQKIADYELSEK